jgi:tetratricopeptide (TPR) repeat protein
VTAGGAGDGPRRILFLTANPDDTSRLNLGIEVREVRRALRAGTQSPTLTIQDEPEVCVEDLQHLLAVFQPHIVHFSGHGSEARKEIIIYKSRDESFPVPKDALATLLAGVECVVLNACSSAEQAQQIAARGPVAIGMAGPISTSDATCFSRGFYGKLADGGSYSEAYQAGRLQLALEAREGKDLPRISRAATGAATLHNLKQRVLFVGRRDEVEDVERALAGTARATITTRASIYGFGGVGKTAIAREVAWRAVDGDAYPGGVFWVEAEGQPLRAVATLAAALKQAGIANLDLDAPAEALATATTKALASIRPPTLIVLDNVDHEGWDAIIPGGAVRLIVTTRNAQLAIGASYEVEALPGDAAVQLAIELGGPPDSGDTDALARVVSEKLGGLPVAIEVAAKAVKSSVGSWRRYEKFLDDQDGEVLRSVLGATEFKSAMYPDGVFAALAGSIKSSSALARSFLDAATVFAPENIPVAWIVETLGWDRDRIEVSRAITELGNRSILKWNKAEDAVSMHRLVHACGREVADRKDWLATNRNAARCVRAWLDGVIDTSKPAEIEPRREHIRQALNAAELADDLALWVELADHVGTHLRNRGLFGECRAWLESCTVQVESRVGPDNRASAILLVNLGTLLNVSGHSAEARPLFERALAVTEAALGGNHPTVAARLTDLATCYSRLGMGRPGLPLLERALEITSASFDAGHTRVAGCLADLGAFLVNDLGERERARPLLERALQIYEVTWGPQHPALVGLLVNLANALGHDEREQAQRLLTRAVDIASAPTPRPWWELSTDLRNLGRVLIRFEMRPVAQTVLERALALDQGVSAQHPAVAADLWLLSVVCLSRGDRKAACPLLEQARLVLDSALGPNNPESPKIQRALDKIREELAGNTGAGSG